MANRLADETSPYLLQHRDNPVDWYPWGEEALERARAEDRPILLSVGYSACHWCHVMERESFEDPDTAASMNEHFVCIKVDREERPDVDAIYMEAVQGMTGHGGWPLTAFLDPDGVPFFGGTYFPPEPRHGMASFPMVIDAVVQSWAQKREQIRAAAPRTRQGLSAIGRLEPSKDLLSADLVTDAVRALRQQADMSRGGFGDAPKFPPASALELLLARMSDGPARAYGLEPPRIAVGARANLVLFDRRARWRVTDAGFRSRSSNSWLLDETLHGQVLATVADGRVAFSL